MGSILGPVAQGFAEALAPLSGALQDTDRFRLLARELGWDVAIRDELLAQLPGAEQLVPGLADGPTLLEQAADLAAQLDALDAGGDDYGGLVASLLDLIVDVIEIVEAWATFEPAGVPDGFFADLAARLPGYLIARWLESHRPLLWALLFLAGAIEEQLVEGDGDEPDRIRVDVDWSQAAALVADLPAALRDHYRWGDAGGWEHALALEKLRRALTTLGVEARRGGIREVFVGSGSGALYRADHAALVDARELDVTLQRGAVEAGDPPVRSWIEQGVVLVPAPASPGGATIDDLVVANLAHGGSAVEVALPDGWTLTVDGQLDATGAARLRLAPDGAPRFDGGAPEGTATIALTSPAGERWRVFGTDPGMRLEIGQLALSLALSVVDGDGELALSAQTVSGGDDAPGVQLVVEPGEGDGFVRELLGEASIELGFDGSVGWSSSRGMLLSGGAELAVHVPIGRTLGPLTLHSVDVEIAASGLYGDPDAPVVSAAIGVAAAVELGPFALVVDGIGIEAQLLPAGDGRALARFGDLAIVLDFKPPDGVGVSLDAGVVSGGGYLYVDRDKGEYAGVVDLEFLAFGLTAIGMLTTQLPDGREGWSLYLSIDARFVPVPLGFGFTLNGIGGIVGVHRALDREALIDGLAAGALDAIMFPDDPIADAPVILSLLDSVFPVTPGGFVFGPKVQIGWGIPTLLTLDGAVVASFRDAALTELVLLGAAAVVLPDDDLALVELHLDTAAVISFEDGAVSLRAELRDSSIWAGITRLVLEGSVAFEARLLDDPYFLLSFGGFHDDYDPPAGFPGRGSLRRLQAQLDMSSAGDIVNVSLEAYLAITPNTVQFGAQLGAYAKAMGFVVEGEAGFNALIRFSPFQIVTDVYFRAGIRAGSWTLAGVDVTLTLTGPGPWKGVGVATFTFLGKDIDFHVSAKLGGKVTDERPAEIPVAAELRERLAEPAAWGDAVHATAAGTVRVRDVDDGDGPRVPPDGRVEVRQSYVPLQQPIDKLGTEVPEQPGTLDVDQPAIAGVAVDDGEVEQVEDWFAPAEFFELGERQRLNTTGYESFKAGVAFGGGTARGGRRDVTLGYEEIRWDPEVRERATRPPGLARLDAQRLALAAGRSLGARAWTAGGRLHELTRARRRAAAPGVTVAPTRWVVIDGQSGEPVDGTARTAGPAAGRLAMAADGGAAAGHTLAAEVELEER